MRVVYELYAPLQRARVALPFAQKHCRTRAGGRAWALSAWLLAPGCSVMAAETLSALLLRPAAVSWPPGLSAVH